MIKPEIILSRKCVSKHELRQALAHVLGLPCPNFDKPKSSVSTECKNLFLQTYENHTSMQYAWQAKDSGCLNQIVKKIYAIANDTNDTGIVASFEFIMKNLPQWYIAHGLSLCVINSKFNEIISEIKNGTGKKGKSAVSTDYKQRIIDDLQS